MFKEKSSKKKLNIENNELSTLDALHNKMIKKFESIDKEKTECKENLAKYETISNSIYSDIENSKLSADIYNSLWSSNIELKEKIIELKNKLQELDSYDEIEYYKNTSDILFKYYETVEKQSNINNDLIPNSLSNNIKINIVKNYKNELKKRKKIPNSLNVLDALNNTNNNETFVSKDTVKEIAKNIPNIVQSNHLALDECITEQDNIIDKSVLVDKYMSIINKQYVRNIDQEEIEICKVCKSSMICLQYDAIMICDVCGYQELLLVEQNRPILKQNTKDTSHFSYKRINHFREWCNQVQGKESTDIPDEIFERILNEIKKEKITDTKTITYTKMRDILKRLRINKYYEHINYIINRINGIPTPQFSPELEDKLCNMFRNIQAPFLKHCPKDRKNFLSYSYVLYKFFQILGLNEYLKYFPLLKSREKLYVQDQIWKKICKELNYEVIPSL
jgi:hypothetical protein